MRGKYQGRNPLNLPDPRQPLSVVEVCEGLEHVGRRIRRVGTKSHRVTQSPPPMKGASQQSEMGIVVEHTGDGISRATWVNVDEARDNQTRGLVRRLLAMGFMHWPGKGYWK